MSAPLLAPSTIGGAVVARPNYDFPEHRGEASSSSFPVERESESYREGMPIAQDLENRLTTPVDQPGIDNLTRTLPVVSLAPVLLYMSKVSSARKSNTADREASSGYVPNEKHRTGSDREASIDPFYYQRDRAEKLLHEAIEKGYQTKNGKQYYSPIRDVNGELHVFVFQPTHNDGREYHGYLYETVDGKKRDDKDIMSVAKKWKNEGIIENKEYKKIINNKMNWGKGPKKEFQ